MTTSGAGVHVTGRRIVATIIDGIIVGAAYSGTAATGDSGAQTRAASGSLLFAAIYYILMERFVGRTVGKLITGIKVVDAATGARPGLGAVFLRTLLRLIDGIAGYLVAFIVVVNSSRRRRLGDMAANTLVVRA